MDPRHPEQAISRMRELMKQYDRIEADMNKATTSAQLGQLEREGGLVVQEICLVAPRIHEAMMQTSRQRRHDLARGVAFDYKPEEKVGKYTKATIALGEKPAEKLKDDAEFKKVIDESIEVVEKAKDIVEKALKDKADVIGEENVGGESGPVEKPKKKTTRKKKTTKKADEGCKEK